MNTTLQQFDGVIKQCADIFEKKMQDYGAAWRILRPSSLTDQIFIKAQRIRTIEEKKVQKIEDDIASEYVGIINYSAMALIQLEQPLQSNEDTLTQQDILALHKQKLVQSKQLMEAKNHDYSEAWRDMRISSLTDIILMKLMRIKQIEDNEGKTFVSEGLDANYQDIINYAIFALIKLSEKQ